MGTSVLRTDILCHNQPELALGKIVNYSELCAWLFSFA